MPLNYPVWPPLGSRVHLTHWADGNVLDGTQEDHDLVLNLVKVIETPAAGHHHLVLRVDDPIDKDRVETVVRRVESNLFVWREYGEPVKVRSIGGNTCFYDPSAPEAWSISTVSIALSQMIAQCQWTWEVVADPEPEPEPTIEVGDLVRWMPRGLPDEIWTHRTSHDAIVVATGKHTLTLRTLENVVTKDGLRRDMDDWHAPADRLRLVAKATYRRVD